MGALATILIIIGALLLIVAASFIFCIFPRVKHPQKTSLMVETKFAHRGLHDSEKPENSLAAFGAAVENGYGMELDIHLTRDGRLAVMHDNNVKRMCGVDLLVSENDFSALSDLRLAGSGEHIPAFEEVLALVDGKTPLCVELKADKGNAKALCAAAFELLDSYKGDYCVESFDPRCLCWMKHNRPEIVRGQLACKIKKQGEKFPRLLGFILTNLLMNHLSRPDFVAYDHSRGEPFALKVSRFFGAKIFWWTVRSEEKGKELLAGGDTIIFEKFKA